MSQAEGALCAKMVEEARVVPRSDALVTTSFLFLVASCYY